jgi:hypothetical protein
MSMESRLRTQANQEPLEDAPELTAAAPAEVQAPDADAERSAENILLWRSYLPQDCVDTMIAMGWDRTV